MSAGRKISLFARRFALPVLVAAVLAPFAGILGAAIIDGQMPAGFFTEMGLREFLAIAGYGVMFAGPAILLIGIPAGYMVAQRRAGIGLSLLLLVLIGAVAGWLIMTVMLGVPRGLDHVAASAVIGALPGATAAAIWTLFNLDLFRRPPARV